MECCRTQNRAEGVGAVAVTMMTVRLPSSGRCASSAVSVRWQQRAKVCGHHESEASLLYREHGGTPCPLQLTAPDGLPLTHPHFVLLLQVGCLLCHAHDPVGKVLQPNEQKVVPVSHPAP